MNNKIYKWLAITLLLSVSIFCFLYLTKLQKTENSVPAAAETPSDVTTDKPDETLNPQPEKPIFYNELPRAAKRFDNVAVQNVGGTDAETLSAVHTYGGKYYIFFNSFSNGHDIKTDNPSVVCALLDADLTLIKTVTLNGSDCETFASSKITADGFLIATTADAYSCVYKMNFELVNVGKLTFDAAENLRLYSSNDTYYVAAEKEDKLQMKVVNEKMELVMTAAAYLNNPHIVEIFPTTEGANIFANTDDGFVLLRYSETSGFISVNTAENTELNTVIPYKNGFVGLKNAPTGLILFTTDNDFNVLAEKGIDEMDGVDLFISADNNLSLYKRAGDTAEISVFCEHLDGLITRPTEYYQRFIYRDYGGDKLIGLNGDVATVLHFDGLVFTADDQYSCDGGKAFIAYDGTTFFSSSYKSGIYVNNFGNFDIFAIKNLG